MLHPHSPERRVVRGALAAVLLAIGSTSILLGATAASATELLPTIPLHNATAETSKDCPAGGGAYWHFVLAPNDGGSAFVAITLNLGSETIVVTGAGILPNGSQTDNVFVAVPAGHQLDDLVVEGSSATYSGEVPNKFNLSHVCVGSSGPPVTGPPVTQPPGTQATVPPATVLGATINAPVLPAGPGAQAAPAGAVTPEGTLPFTGSDNLPFLLVGLGCVMGGLGLAWVARAKLGHWPQG